MKPAEKNNTVRLPSDLQKKIEAIAERNQIAVNAVIRLALVKVLPLIEKEGITIKPGKAT